MLVPVYSSDTQLELADKAFGREFNPSLVHQLLVSYQAGSRSGSHKQKTRAEVRGGGKKPWRQKGTGKARAGTIRGPIWRGGGITFAKQPRDYSVKVNRKAYCAAMQCIISRLLREERLIVVEDNVFHLPEPRVKSFRVALQPLASVIAGKLLLMVSTELITNLVLGSRNLRHVRIQQISGLDPVSLVKADITLISRSAMENLNTSWQS